MGGSKNRQHYIYPSMHFNNLLCMYSTANFKQHDYSYTYKQKNCEKCFEMLRVLSSMKFLSAINYNGWWKTLLQNVIYCKNRVLFLVN